MLCLQLLSEAKKQNSKGKFVRQLSSLFSDDLICIHMKLKSAGKAISSFEKILTVDNLRTNLIQESDMLALRHDILRTQSFTTDNKNRVRQLRIW